MCHLVIFGFHPRCGLTHLLFPHRIGCSPAHSCTNAENWEWGFSASSFPSPLPAPIPPPSASSSPSSLGTSVVFGPQVVALRGQVMLVGEAEVRPIQAPLGSRRARPERRSTSLRSLSISARSFNKAPRWDWDRGTKELGFSRWSWWDEVGWDNLWANTKKLDPELYVQSSLSEVGWFRHIQQRYTADVWAVWKVKTESHFLFT